MIPEIIYFLTQERMDSLLSRRILAMCARLKPFSATAKIAVMGGSQAAKVLTQIQVSSMKRKGEEVDQEASDNLYNKIKNRYDNQTNPYYAASRLWVDAIIDPNDTRAFLSIGIEMSDHGVIEKFNPGIIQT